MVQPNLIINFFAIGSCVIAGMVFGFLWYGPVFGKAWAKGMGMPVEFKPDSRTMTRSMILQIIGLFLISYVLAHSGQVWRPSVWGLGADEGSNFMWALTSAFFTWIGFYIPMQLSKVAWENRPWKVFFINTVHDFILLAIFSTILAHWR